jgi:hypothetical protein
MRRGRSWRQLPAPCWCSTCSPLRRLTAVAGYRPATAVSSFGWSAAPAADRPGTDALRVQDVLGHPDLLLTARAARRTRATVGPPGARRELQATGVTVAGADPPVAAGLARSDRVPVDAVGLDRRLGRVIGRRGGIGCRSSVRDRRRRCIRSRRCRCIRGRGQVGRRRRRVRSGRIRSRRRRRVGRWRCGRLGVSTEGRVHLPGLALRIGVGDEWRGRYGDECAGDRGHGERLADVLQHRSFRGCARRNKPSDVGGCLCPGGFVVSSRAVSFGHDSGGVMRRPGAAARRRHGVVAVRSPRSHAGPWIRFCLAFFWPTRTVRDGNGFVISRHAGISNQ